MDEPVLPDEQILTFAAHAADRIPVSNYEGRVLHAVRMAERSILAAAEPSIRADERERCEKTVAALNPQSDDHRWSHGYDCGVEDAVEAIRQLGAGSKGDAS